MFRETVTENSLFIFLLMDLNMVVKQRVPSVYGKLTAAWLNVMHI